MAFLLFKRPSSLPTTLDPAAAAPVVSVPPQSYENTRDGVSSSLQLKSPRSLEKDAVLRRIREVKRSQKTREAIESRLAEGPWVAGGDLFSSP